MNITTTLMQQLEKTKGNDCDSAALTSTPRAFISGKATAAYIKAYYEKLDCQITECGDGYGLIVDIIGEQCGKQLALRADFDALAVEEDNQLPFRSQVPGVMHACGHDGHTAYLMVLAKNLITLKDQLKEASASSTNQLKKYLWRCQRHDCRRLFNRY